jgi:CheY-like chemotaxis protein
MVAASRTRSAAYRRTSGLVWALAIVGLVVGGFVLVTMEVLLAHARTERSEAFRVVQSSNRALVRLEGRARARLRRAVRHPARALELVGHVHWVTDLSEAEHDLRTILPGMTGKEQPTSLRTAIDGLVALRAELVTWSGSLGLTDESGIENQTRQYAERIDVCFGELRTVKDEIWSASTEALQQLVLSSEREIELAQLRILIAGLAGGALFLFLTFFTWRAIGVQVAAIEATNRELDLAIVQARAASHAKSEFLANMSHEIRTPMNGVLGMTSLLLDTGLDTTQRELAETVKSSAEALLEIITTSSTSRRSRPASCNPSRSSSARAPWSRTWSSSWPSARRRRISSWCARSKPACRAACSAIRCACDRCSSTWSATRSSSPSWAKCASRAGPVRGPGIRAARWCSSWWWPTPASASRPRRAPSCSSPSRRRMVRPRAASAARAWGSRFRANWSSCSAARSLSTASSGRGTRFNCQIPFGRSSEQPESEAPPAVLRERRVLVVDDHVEQAQTMARILTRAGLEVAVAHDVASARAKLDEARLKGSVVDAVVLDMQLSGDDAVGYARELAGADDAPAVILLSPRVRSSLSTSAVRELAVPRLFKPVRQAVLLECLEDVLLGKTAGALPKASADDAAALRAKSLRANVLLVEDNHVNQIVAKRMLEVLGHRVTIAGNGRVALECYARERFDVILMDCQMPELDGYAATRDIRSREGTEQHTPIIAMTAHAMVGDRELCIAAGMDDYLTKPVKLEELADMVAKWSKAPQA